jgi:hypothetical protein
MIGFVFSGPYWVTRFAREPVFYSENDEAHKLPLVSGFFAPPLTQIKL